MKKGKFTLGMLVIVMAVIALALMSSPSEQTIVSANNHSKALIQAKECANSYESQLREAGIDVPNAIIQVAEGNEIYAFAYDGENDELIEYKNNPYVIDESGEGEIDEHMTKQFEDAAHTTITQIVTDAHVTVIGDEDTIIFNKSNSFIDNFGFNPNSVRITIGHGATEDFGDPVTIGGGNQTAEPTSNPNPTNTPVPTVEPNPTTEPTPTYNPEGYIEIHNLTDFLAVNDNLDANYMLMTDINLMGMNWLPFGFLYDDTGYPFTGKFVGNGHTISGLNWQTATYRGLFFDNQGWIEGIIVEAPNIVSGGGSGLIAAQNSNSGTITKCGVTGNITIERSGNYWHTGGVSGFNYGVIDQCWSNVNISGSWSVDMFNNYIGQCFNGCITGHSCGVVSNCLAFGSVVSPRAAGIVADYYSGDIVNCYSLCYMNDNDVQGSNWTKHIWAQTSSGLRLSGVFYHKGLMYKNGIRVDTWDTGTNHSDGAGCALRSDEFLAQTFIDAGWSTDIWNLADGEYPTLKNNPIPDYIPLEPPVTPAF